ncbi:DNA phosphorothioation-associated putative methyltransferase [Nitrosomonas sp. JL21]|uniref:DNA phosphorothioation-associated putative methyltransferase n=1 Tax=Nitrosomonas sp. JL21 TaxID=153949 RepID=UPI0013689276|nr:DNA phosphorothioation-associated putative methyltransferase [Nitrosomonas sp. JL21]MXS79125.1 DNA phosphorothioation-associated putative methyltransferase [Nitrosomonas sp. JL21]
MLVSDSTGKFVHSSRYLHIEAFGSLSLTDLELIADAEKLAQVNRNVDYNVVKISENKEFISFLYYPDFFNQPFPKLNTSWRAELTGTRQVRKRSYADSFNPPILHRKELLLPLEHTEIAKFQELTSTAEALGLFDDPSRIGFQNQWKKIIAAKGYQLIDYEFVPLGNDLSKFDKADNLSPSDEVQRHLTALVRYGFSAPVQLLARFGFLDGSRSVFDYGCGRGDDLRGLQENGIQALGWDPHYAPDNSKQLSNIVNLGFVINVIEDINERIEALQGAYSLAQELLVVSVMLANQKDSKGKPLYDGILTSRGTFQKYYTPTELEIFVEQHLHEESIPVAPGVFFVFKDKDAEQRFLVGRSRSRSNLLRAASQVRSHLSPSKAERDAARYAEHQTLLDSLWQQWLETGREPDKSEVKNLPQVLEVFGSLPKTLRFLRNQKDDAILETAQKLRQDDLLVYIALSMFEKRKSYRYLEPSLQRDIKAFFTNYGTAQQAATELLFQIAQPELIDAACRNAASKGLGWYIENESLQLHTSLVEQLPTILRIYIGCGTALYGDITSADLIKIHTRSGKLTLMQFDDFFGKPIPKMMLRVKISFHKQEFYFFEYDNEFEPPYLYLKSRFINEEMESYAEQIAFDNQLEALNLFDLSGYGPNPPEFIHSLSLARWKIDGMRLIRSQSIPNLDTPCGKYFTYRDFIICGETQAKTGLSNLPKEADSYTALYELATNILDPVIDYFGMIKLTYGFCSIEVAKEIPGRIAPKLDQHAAHEKKPNGKLICERLGAACDFIIEDEDMEEVALWISENTKFDRIYLYGADCPIHVSFSNFSSRQITKMKLTSNGKYIPFTTNL